MAELFTQKYKQQILFQTEDDIAADLQTQFGTPSTGQDLLLDTKLAETDKNQSSRLDSESSEPTGMEKADDGGTGDISGILQDSPRSNKNTITGTNTPRASRTSAYYDLLRSQHINSRYKAPAYRVADAIESPLQAGAGALNYHDDFDTDAVQNAGLHMAVAQTVVEGNIMSAAADSAFVIGKQTGNILKDLKDESINAKDALKACGQVLRLQGGKSVVKIGGATLRSTEQYLCRTYKSVWMEYVAKSLNQKTEYFNQHSMELQAYRTAAAKLEKEGIDQSVEIDKVNNLAQSLERKINDLDEQLRESNLQEQDYRQERKTLTTIQADLFE